MTQRFSKPCLQPGCPEFAQVGGYCIQHKRQTMRQYNQSRDADTQRLYNSTHWKHLRDRYKSRYPLCQACERQGHTTVGTVIDHVIEYKPGDNFFDWNNLQNLCASCHNAKHKGVKAARL